MRIMNATQPKGNCPGYPDGTYDIQTPLARAHKELTLQRGKPYPVLPATTQSTRSTDEILLNSASG